MSIALARRLDRLESVAAVGRPVPLDEVTADDLLSGRCFAMPRTWTLEDLIASGNELPTIAQEKK